MLSRISFRNFAIFMALASSSSDAFNPLSNKPPTAPSATTPATDINNQELFAAVVDSSNQDDEDDEMIAAAVAGGSAVLGTVVGSPLVVGAALGYAGSQVLAGEKGEHARKVIGRASEVAIEKAADAIDFAKHELETENGDISKVSAKMMSALREKALDAKSELHAKASNAKSEITNAPTKLKSSLVETVESEEFKTLPKRSLAAFRSFLESDEVKAVSASALQSIKAGLASDEMKALRNRASKMVMEDTTTTSPKLQHQQSPSPLAVVAEKQPQPLVSPPTKVVDRADDALLEAMAALAEVGKQTGK